MNNFVDNESIVPMFGEATLHAFRAIAPMMTPTTSPPYAKNTKWT